MPGFNIGGLFAPPKNQSDLSDLLKLVSVMVQQAAINEDGGIYNPNSYNAPIKILQEKLDSPGLSESERLSLQKSINSLKLKQIHSAIAQKKTANANVFQTSLEGDLRSLAAEKMYDIGAYVSGAVNIYEQYFNEAEKQINFLKEHQIDTSSLEKFKKQIGDELSNYYLLENAIAKKDNKTLSEFSINYGISPSGRISQFKISYGNPSSSQPSDIALSFDNNGNLIPQKKNEGLRVNIIRPKPTLGEEIPIGNAKFIYNGKGYTVDGDFNPTVLKWASSYPVRPGSFLRDSKNQKWYVNSDLSFSPLNDFAFKELGGDENNIIDLTPADEFKLRENFKPLSITPTPEPIMEKFKQDQMNIEKMKKEMPTTFWGVLNKNLGEDIGKGIRGFVKILQEQPKINEIPKEKQTSNWEIPSQEMTKTIQNAKEDVKSFTKNFNEKPMWQW